MLSVGGPRHLRFRTCGADSVTLRVGRIRPSLSRLSQFLSCSTTRVPVVAMHAARSWERGEGRQRKTEADPELATHAGRVYHYRGVVWVEHWDAPAPVHSAYSPMVHAITKNQVKFYLAFQFLGKSIS